MIGFQHSRHADVNLITDNLRDRYKDLFSILKELVQNADDAGAEKLRFGIALGNPGNSHELLRGPGLVVINDGAFRHSDYEAICSFGLNSKAGDTATIGKFGLGMKSVFHLCEAIFFIAGGGGRSYRELLSPWGKEFRPDWDLSETQQEELLTALRMDCLAAVKWESAATPFILYLPLRRRAHLILPSGDEAGAIIEEYPGDNGRVAQLLKADDTTAKLASLLPLLHNIRSVQVYLPEADGAPQLVSSSELELDDSRPLRDHVDGESPLSSVIRVGTRRLRFAGFQRHVMTERLRELQSSPAWPASWVRDDRGRAYHARDKAQPHAAAVFGQENITGALTIRWAVFLPIEQYEETIPLSSGTGGYLLTLHGHFFVDAGRNGLYGLDETGDEGVGGTQDEAWVRRSWNRELAAGSTLDLVIRSLDHFTNDLELSDERASSLTRAIAGSGFWKRWKRHIAANYNWVHTINRVGCRWRVVSSKATLPIPRAPDIDPGRPWRVFPQLDTVCAHAILFESDAPNLVASDNDLGSWDEEQLTSLIEHVDVAQVFSSSTDSEYLAEFLERIRYAVRSTLPVQLSLCNLLRAAVSANGLHALRGVAARVQRIAALILPDRKLRIALRSLPVAEFLIQQPISVLPWPRDLDSADPAVDPNVDDVESLLRALAGKHDHAEPCRQYAEDLLKQLSGDARREVLGRAGDLSILSAFDCKRGQKVSVSANVLRDGWRQRTLFRTGQGTTDRDRAGLGTHLQATLVSASILVINRDLAELILDAEAAQSLATCDSSGALHCLACQNSDLGDLSTRTELLRRVQLPERDPVAARGMRFLLHGHPEQIDSTAPLWVERGDGLSTWRKVWKAVVPAADQWTVVQPELANLLAYAIWQAVDLRSIVPESVVSLVTETGCDGLNSLHLDSVEYETILSYERWESQTWKQLPFHLTTTGHRVAVEDEGTFLNYNGIDIPPGLMERATLLVRSSDPRLAALQDQRIARLDERAAILIALKDPNPERWCGSILDWLAGCLLSEELIRSLADRPWLRMNSGRAVKPTDFIVLPELENQITSIADHSDVFGTLSLLSEDLRAHSALQRLNDTVCPKSQSLGALVRMLRSSHLLLGEPVIETGDLKQVADVLRNADEGEALQEAWAIVLAVCEAYGDEHGSSIFSALRREIPEERVKRLLQKLSGTYQQPGGRKAFLAYLRLLAASMSSRDALRDLMLCAQDGSWKYPGELCHSIPGADKSALILKEQGEVLERWIQAPWKVTHGSDGFTNPNDKVESLEAYFAPWLRRGLNTQVGALTTLIAGRTALQFFATSLLHPHTREWLVSEIPWRHFESAVERQPLDGLAPTQAFERCSFAFFVSNVAKIPTFSLLGTRIEVPAEARSAHLLLGRPYPPGGSSQTRVVFRRLEIAAYSDAELSNILRATSEEILRYVYLQPANLQKVWTLLDHTEHFHIAMAEKLILEYLPFYLGQLRPQNAPLLTQQLQKVDDHRRLVVEYESRPDLEQRKKEHEASRKELRDMLKTDAAVQTAVLDAVRIKLRDSQYQPSSIPFELFQNADDAYVQLQEMGRFSGGAEADSKNRFIVVNSGETISFIHWGRPVNATGSHGFDGRKRGYHRDLEKMLTLSSSEKQTHLDGASAPVTGRFGLGFKSVLLVCDRPRVLSGSLQVEIVGGVLPRALLSADAHALRQQIDDWESHSTSPATVISMPAVAREDSDQTLSEFIKCAGYLTAFGLSVREILYIDESGEHTAKWSGRTIATITSIERGTLPAAGLRAPDATQAIKIQLDGGSVIFGLGPDGIRPLPRGTPAVWVTGPTREDEQFGFAVSSMFDVDPGRARLSANEKRNLELAENLGTQLGGILRSLRMASWHLVREDLGLSSGISEYQFWESLWSLWRNVISRPDSAARRIMFGLLRTALREIAGDLRIVPNGMPSDARTLTTGRLIHHKLTGVLAIDSCARAVSNWPVWDQRGFGPDVVVSAQNGEALAQLGFKELPSLNLATVASWLNGQTIREEEGRFAGELLHALPPPDGRKQECVRDLEDARQSLATVWFYSQAKTMERAGDLVAVTARGEEGRRAAFAPAGRRLNSGYDEHAVEFFRFCRGPMIIRPGELARWARDAEDLSARRSALEYLVNGERALEMQRDLRDLGIRGTWLANPSEVAGLDPTLLDELRRPPLEQQQCDGINESRSRVQHPRAILERIETWWLQNGLGKLQTYDREFYPHARIPRLVSPWEEEFDRSEWMVLFGRAAFYKMGRLTDVQHRGFIEHAQRENYWSVFAGSDPQDHADDWMDVLESFCDEQIDAQTWEYWMRSFPDLYKLSRWLPEYAELFLGLDRQVGRYELEAVLKPRTDPMQQGGGIDAPPPGLGIGACFVVRELLRHGHISNASAHEHAFVPTAAVRRLLERIGLDIEQEGSVEVSAQIYHEVSSHLTPDRAIFGGAFDIPFQIIASDPELQNSLTDGLDMTTAGGSD